MTNDLHRGHLPTTSVSGPPAPHTRSVTCNFTMHTSHWLSVRAAVSHERIAGLEGSLPKVLAEFGPWYQHEAFLSGPVDMVTQATQTLVRQGVTEDRIHHDPFDVPALEAALMPKRMRQQEG